MSGIVLLMLTVPRLSVAAEVESFSLIDAENDQPIAAFDPLVDGAVIDLSTLGASQLNVRANVDGAVGSVSFDLSGADSESRTESVLPYSLFGDTAGDYNPWTPPVGAYSLAARSHTMVGGGGEAGTDLVITFDIQVGSPPPDGDGTVAITGELEQWHPVVLALSGPGAGETMSPNPFLDFRFNVLFTGPSGQQLDVPGFFAGDGQGEGIGNRWHAMLSPDEIGTWTYVTSFRAGTEVAVDATGTAGAPLAPFDGVTGTFDVQDSTAVGVDLRAAGRGLLKNRGGHYLTDSDGDPWLKAGPDIPENFLGYEGFDNTPDAGHAFAPHVVDWRAGDPDWDGGAGRGIIGALNFIADRGANTIYFLPMNVQGDGNDTFPTIGAFEKTRYDISKLVQWEIVFRHAQERGIFLHFVLAETESGNENYHDGGELGPERKLYYRMLAARFGHHVGLEWNLGEENDYGTVRHEAFAAYLKAVDPYDHPVTTHTKGGQYDAYYGPLLGNGDFDITSFQGGNSRNSMFDLIVSWREQSADAGVPWAISFDEPQKIENDPDDMVNGYPHGRRDKMWPVLMAGGAGFEWYVQQDGGGHSLDQQIEDFRLMEGALSWSGYIRAFLEPLPLESMTSSRTLASSSAGDNTYALFLPGEVYALYNDRNGGIFSLDLTAVDGGTTFDIRWFDPRNGVFAMGSLEQVSGGAVVDLGSAPNSLDNDWACLVLRTESSIFSDGFESGDASRWSLAVP